MKQGQTEELSLMYRLLERTDSGLQAVAKRFQQLVLDDGQRLVGAKRAEIVEKKGGADNPNSNPVRKGLALVRDLTKLHATYKSMVEGCFAKNNVFTKSLDLAFKSFLNTSGARAIKPALCAAAAIACSGGAARRTGSRREQTAIGPFNE
eukprot:SAG22_NODE_1204_length_5172_cov_4.546028_3_plen_150_part_00